MKINTSSKYRINVENTSPIPCEVMVKSFKQDHITFDNYLRHLEELKSVSSVEGNSIRVERPTTIIKPYQRVEFMLSLDCIRQETVEEYFEIMVKDGDSSIFFTVMGEIQKPRVSLNRNEIKLGTIYAGVTEKVDIDHK